MSLAELHLGDCKDVIREIDLASIDAVVTDPPYGISFVKGPSGSAVRGRRSLRRNANPIVGGDEPFGPLPWLRWPCVFFGADHFASRLPETGSYHAWDKKAHSTLEDSFSDVEFIWCSRPGKSRIISHLWKGVLQASEKGRPKYHVNQKPVAVMRWAIGLLGLPPGATVLDPYMGSGSTGVACMAMGLNFIGIEVDGVAFHVAEERVGLARGLGPMPSGNGEPTTLNMLPLIGLETP